MAHGQGYLRQRSAGSWTITVFLGKDANGKPRQVTKTVRGTKHDAQRRAGAYGRGTRPRRRSSARAPHHRRTRRTLARWQEARPRQLHSSQLRGAAARPRSSRHWQHTAARPQAAAHRSREVEGDQGRRIAEARAQRLPRGKRVAQAKRPLAASFAQPVRGRRRPAPACVQTTRPDPCRTGPSIRGGRCDAIWSAGASGRPVRRSPGRTATPAVARC